MDIYSDGTHTKVAIADYGWARELSLQIAGSQLVSCRCICFHEFAVIVDILVALAAREANPPFPFRGVNRAEGLLTGGQA